MRASNESYAVDNERFQAEVMVEAFDKFQEKEKKYQGLWRKGGWRDSAHHIRHKASRISDLLDLKTDIAGAPESRVEDAIDLINYCVFFIRNVRNPLPKLPERELLSARIIDRWVVTDKWWTTTPIHRAFRIVEFDDGSTVTQYRDKGQKMWSVQRGDGVVST